MTRLSVNINDETATALRDLADRREISVTEVVRRAVSVLKFIEDETDQDKSLQLVDNETDERTKLQLLH